MNLLQDISVLSTINEKTVAKVSKLIQTMRATPELKWINYRDKSENLQTVKNEDLAINTSR